jgi:hypothetical protein
MDKSLQDVQKFIKFAAKELNLTSLPHIHFVGKEENSKNAFGHFTNKKGQDDVYIRITDRHPIDVMRTIAHELIHYGQRLKGLSANEDQANAQAGRIMRKFDTTYPSVFKDKAILNTVREDLGVVSNVPTNTTGPAISNYDPLIQFKNTGSMFKRKQPKGLRNIVKKEKQLERRAETRNDQ